MLTRRTALMALAFLAAGLGTAAVPTADAQAAPPPVLPYLVTVRLAKGATPVPQATVKLVSLDGKRQFWSGTTGPTGRTEIPRSVLRPNTRYVLEARKGPLYGKTEFTYDPRSGSQTVLIK